MSQPQEGAVEVKDVASAASEIERRMTENAEPITEEVIQEDESVTAETQDEQEPSEQEPDAEQDNQDESDETESQDSAEPETDQEDTFESVSELAAATGMSVEDFMASIKTTTKVNGEELEVTLQDLKNGYQMESDYRKKTTELAEQRKAFEQERTQESEKLQNSLSQVNALLTNADQELLDEYNAVDWANLREFDKEEFLLQESDFAKRAQRLEQRKSLAQEKANELIQKQQELQQAQIQDTLAQESELLLTAIPSWQDQEVRESEQKQIVDFATQNGFSEDEVNQVYDHRVVSLLRMAMKAQSLDDKVEVAKKKVKTLPKVVKPGAKQSKQDVANRNRLSKTDKFKKSGKREDLVDALLDRM